MEIYNECEQQTNKQTNERQESEKDIFGAKHRVIHYYVVIFISKKKKLSKLAPK